jgi:hypothetical protein
MGLNATTAASDGEVEDYAVTFASGTPTIVPNTLTIIPGAPALSCTNLITNGDFESATAGSYWAPNRSGAVAVPGWSVAGGGTDSYGQIVTGGGAIAGKSLYFGNAYIRSVSPTLSNGFTFDANKLATNVPSSIVIRGPADDVAGVAGSTPGTTGNCCDMGGTPLVASQTVATTAGQVYRLRVNTKGEGGTAGYSGMMKVEVGGASAHMRAPEGNISDAFTFEFTATGASTTVTFTNYGHFASNNGGWCDPATSGFCTVGGLDGGNMTSEATLDDVQLCPVTMTAYDYSDAPASYGSASHMDVAGMRLGATIDTEAAAQPNATATGDGADEDGVTLPGSLSPSTAATISVSATGTGGYLAAWMDWNRDGDFSDSGEQVATDLQDNASGDTNAAAGTIAFSVTPRLE